MIESYFFVPADKPRYLEKIKTLYPDFFVIDLEDSVSPDKKAGAFENVKKIFISDNTFVRIPFKENIYNSEQITFLVKKFRGKIVLPKVKSNNDLQKIINVMRAPTDLDLIILVENPSCFLNIEEMITKNKKHIRAIGFGSHDFCSFMGMKHTFENINYYKKQLLLIAKAYEIDFIDSVDINIGDLTTFTEECVYAFETGMEGKFIIHPSQLERMNKIEYLSELEINEMEEVYRKASLIASEKRDIVTHNGKVYEKPHIDRIKKLINLYTKRKK